ncbi:MAG: molybdopterin-dependent oxidoreductase, partial [Bacillales bacterium]
MSTVSKYADLVLPATTPWEKVGMLSQGNREALFVYTQVTEPLYEAKDEEEMHKMIAEKLGLNVKELYPLSPKQQFFNQIAGSEVIKEDGTGYEPLVTITQKDIDEWGVEGKPQQGRIPLKEFLEKGVYQAELKKDQLYIAGKDFRDDPENNPLDTASGKLEIHCQPLSDIIEAFGFTKIAPVAKYDPPEEGYEDTFADYEKGIKGDYPLQLYTIHYPRRSHSVFDNVPQLREAFPQEFFMSPEDAKKRGIKDGDTVLIKSRHGKVLRPVTLTERIMPGVTTLGEGAWVERDDETGIDKA